MKILLGNLRHKTIGQHSPFVPINLGYIASYLLSKISDVKIHLHDDIDKTLKDVKEWNPDVVGLSNYCWNSNISSLVFRYSKKNNSNILTVAGGPEFPEDNKERKNYLLCKKEIDFYIYREGEIAFYNLIKYFIKNRNIQKLRQKYLDGIISIHPISQKIIVGSEISRLKNLDVISSPYLTKLLDSWLNGFYVPSLETARGCPFKCQYCHTGIDCYNKIGNFSTERIKKELDYICSKMKKYPEVLLSICDTNFGIYKKDKIIIDHIEELQKKYNWPIRFDATTGKTNHYKILDMIKQLGSTMRLNCAVQSMNPSTLKVIQRRNRTIPYYKKLLNEAKKNGIVSVAEFIMPLPEETKKSFLNGLKKNYE